MCVCFFEFGKVCLLVLLFMVDILVFIFYVEVRGGDCDVLD